MPGTLISCQKKRRSLERSRNSGEVTICTRHTNRLRPIRGCGESHAMRVAATMHAYATPAGALANCHACSSMPMAYTKAVTSLAMPAATGCIKRTGSPLRRGAQGVPMYVWGTANPSGEANETYKGLYLRHRDIDAFIREMPGKPVKVEHAGPSVGNVVHAWKNNNKGLDCILEIKKHDSIDGAVIASLINDKCAKELSLGYRVRMDMSSGAADTHLEKEVVEVSIVKRGMRPDCHIHAFSATSAAKRVKR